MVQPLDDVDTRRVYAEHFIAYLPQSDADLNYELVIIRF